MPDRFSFNVGGVLTTGVAVWFANTAAHAYTAAPVTWVVQLGWSVIVLELIVRPIKLETLWVRRR